ncbi:MAG: Ig-like domain-containing protein [bacterium]|nr:Ig-like domain-containing protein [bacterium]
MLVTEGSKNANLSISSNDPDTPAFEALLTGKGVDNTLPTSIITSPLNGAIIFSITQITGIAADDEGISQVEVSIRRNSDNKYWNGTGWEISAEKLWLLVTGTNSWSYPWPSGISDGNYLIYSRAQDYAGNIAEGAVSQVTIDNISPVSKVTVPPDEAILPNLAQISGTAWDNVEIDKVEVRIQRNKDAYYFTAGQ